VFTPASLKRGARAAAAAVEASVGVVAPPVRDTNALFAGLTKSGFIYFVITAPSRGGLFVDVDVDAVEEDATADVVRGGDAPGAMEREDIMPASGLAMMTD
jgi:hypothetical protein